jgi:hypothetical protein
MCPKSNWHVGTFQPDMTAGTAPYIGTQKAEKEVATVGERE